MNRLSSMPPVKPELTVLYGSTTGNSRRLALNAVKTASQRGVSSEIHDLETYDPSRLSDESRVLIVIGTWGDGEPPRPARRFCEQVFGGCLPNLDHLEYTVLAMGDSCFPKFCGCGVKIDECLAAHGARRMMGCRKLDAKFHEDFLRWQVDFLEQLGPQGPYSHYPSSNYDHQPASH